MCMTLTLTIRMGQGQMRDIHSRNVHDLDFDLYNGSRSNARHSQSKCAWPWLWPLEWAKVKCETFTVEMCMTLTLTFRMVQGEMWVSQSKDHVRLLVLAIVNFYPICHRLQDINIWSSQWMIVEYLTLKMKVKYVDDLVEDWQADVACRRPHVCKRWSF